MSNPENLPDGDSLVPNDWLNPQLQLLFYSQVFHEMKIPLTVMHSYAQILVSRLPANADFDEHRRLTNLIVRKGEEMVEFFEELQEVLRLPLGKIPHEVNEYNLNWLVEEAMLGLTPGEQAKINCIPYFQPLNALVDAPRFERSVKAVLGFMLELQQPVEILITVNNQESPFRAVIKFQLKDFSLTPAEIISLFDLYRSVRPLPQQMANLPRAGRLDISLYLARHILQYMGGELNYEAKLPGFVITLPLVAQS